MYLPPIIGITGRAGAGKDLLAGHLARTYGYKRYSCADSLKDLLNARFGWTPEMWEDREWKERTSPEHGTRQDSARPHNFSPRDWAQWLGTEVGRNLGGDDLWINATLAKAAAEGNHARTVIADIRFNNEAHIVQQRGGIVIALVRDNLPPVKDHVSERGVDDLYIDYVLENNHSPLSLFARAEHVITDWSREIGRARA